MSNQDVRWQETVARAQAQPPAEAILAAIAELRDCYAQFGLLSLAVSGAAGPVPGPVKEIMQQSLHGANRMRQVVDDILWDVVQRLRALDAPAADQG